MKLIGGLMDGKEIGEPAHPVVQGLKMREGIDTIIYIRQSYYSFWPIPGWEMVETDPDVSLGETHPNIHFRIRNYFTEEASKKVDDFMKSDFSMPMVLFAYENRDDFTIDRHLDTAIAAAHKLAVLTGLDERPFNRPKGILT